VRGIADGFEDAVGFHAAISFVCAALSRVV
jgi:hypothetical protein